MASLSKMNLYPERAVLEGLQAEVFKLVSSSATPVQWREWLRVPLEHAAARGNFDLFNKLLGAGAELNSQDEYGCTPLHAAASGGHDGIVSTLLLRGADKDALNGYEQTPLILASKEGHLCVVETLLAAGADLSVRDHNGWSAIDIAVEKGHVPVIQAILDHGSDVNDGDDDGCTALHVAAQYDQAGAVDALVEAGADIELKDSYGFTPFLEAAYYAKCKPMVALRRHGAIVTAQDNHGDTALHLACFGKFKGLEAAVDLLLRWGADETALNNAGKTPAERLDQERQHYGKRAIHDEIERTRVLLVRAPADRVWRRRGWLVMLRSRAEKTRRTATNCDSRGDTIDGPGAAGGPRKGEGCKAARREGTGSVGGDHVVRRQASSADGAYGDGGDGGDGGVLRGSVGLLVGMEPEGVFRTVLSFL